MKEDIAKDLIIKGKSENQPASFNNYESVNFGKKLGWQFCHMRRNQTSTLPIQNA